jgi:hypothetical protein
LLIEALKNLRVNTEEGWIDKGTFLFVQAKTQLAIAATEIGVLASVIQRLSAVSYVFGMLVVELFLLAQMDISLVYCAAWTILVEIDLINSDGSLARKAMR